MASLKVLNDDGVGAGAGARVGVARQTRGAGAGIVLRVSLLQQCQYRCAYCRPGSVVPPSVRDRWLTAVHYERFAHALQGSHVRKVRFTGGEPLLRRDVADVVTAFSRALPGVDLGLTTNGQHLGERLHALKTAGLARATVHIDSLRADRYRTLMGDGDLRTVLANVERARCALHEVKLNVVVQRGQNEDEIGDFLRWSAVTGVQVRFIELMNTGSAASYTHQAFFSGAEIVAAARRFDDVEPIPRRHRADPAALWRTRGGVTFGVIASDTEPFCEACDRLRLTADGRLRGCLYEGDGVPIGDALRADAARDELDRLLARAIAGKRSHHPTSGVAPVPFSMADVGG